jgi:hypothetical protein
MYFLALSQAPPEFDAEIAGAFHDARIIAELTPHFLDHLKRRRAGSKSVQVRHSANRTLIVDRPGQLSHFRLEL